MSSTLVERMGRLADRVRKLHTKFGTRSYSVFLVHRSWSGGEIGKGQASVTSEDELLPVPAVHKSGTLRRRMAFGAQDMAHVVITEVSLVKYDEDFLRGGALQSDNQRFGPGVEFYYELRPTKTSGTEAERYSLESVVEERENVTWTITLIPRSANRVDVQKTAGRF